MTFDNSQLEIGKTYKNGWGVTTEIVDKTTEPPYVFKGLVIYHDGKRESPRNEILYKSDGEFIPFDLRFCRADRDKYNLIIGE